ncbi:MAG: serine aminopeptidase domain-containing protein [Thermodesulfobacteriota bacterium]
MNRFAFNATSFVIKQLYHLSKADVKVRGEENIPGGSVIFTINHFTRVETLILPYHIEKITKKPVWSLAWHGLFKGRLANFLERAGAVSTKDPNRDRLIINKLLKGSADWIIFPEGLMNKNKNVLIDGDYGVNTENGWKRPHTGAANLALRCQFYRQRLKWLSENDPKEMERLCNHFELSGEINDFLDNETYIVPVNLTYYPIRARENAVNFLASYLLDKVPEKINEEIMTEGSMLLNGVDIDISFGKAINVSGYLEDPLVKSDIKSSSHYDFDDPIKSIKVLRTKARELMYRYMNSIYSMTTVNHDHLFSYILKYLPKDEIDPEDLKRRVYLASQLDIDSERVVFHKSLQSNQISLLTDDRYKKFFEFYHFCRERNILFFEDKKLKKNTKMFEIPEYAHDTRMVNPVAVFANEIEPLIVLAPHLDRLAKDSAVNIKRRVISNLSTKPVLKFNKDYSAFADKGSDYIPENKYGMPRLSIAENRKKGIVLMHGYLSSPQEMVECEKFFHEKGYTVYLVRFPGHGTGINNLDEVSYKDFIHAAEEGAKLLSLLCEEVFLCGISIGAAASIITGSKLDLVKKVALIAPPVKFLNYIEPYSNGKQGIKSIIGKLGFKKNYTDALICKYPKTGYIVNNENSDKQAEKLSNIMYDTAEAFKKPCIIIQSYNDKILDPKGAAKIFERTGSENKVLLYINSDKHSIINSDKKMMVMENIKMFFENGG